MSVHAAVVPTQGIYRTLLRAMSRPGRLHRFSLEHWENSLRAVCETLFDHEVSFCLAGGAPPAWDRMVFTETKARKAPMEDADWILVNGHNSHGAAEHAKRGSLAYPDQSATLIYVMQSPLPAAERPPRIDGPGLPYAMEPEANPFLASEWDALRQTNAEYPLGVDAICLIGLDEALCIPRSTRIVSE